MYFCPNCNYLFDISKSNTIESNENKKSIKKVTDAIKLFESNTPFNDYKSEFTIDELNKNIKFKKYSDQDKKKFDILFQTNNIIGVEFKCYNCNFSKGITESVILYQYEIDNKKDKIINIEDNELMCQNPILPRTHDYNCKNTLCPTINNNKLKKEAVFFRDKESYKINYICCICYHNW